MSLRRVRLTKLGDTSEGAPCRAAQGSATLGCGAACVAVCERDDGMVLSLVSDRTTLRLACGAGADCSRAIRLRTSSGAGPAALGPDRPGRSRDRSRRPDTCGCALPRWPGPGARSG